MKEIKLYKVEFITYTNACNNTVSNGKDDIKAVKYIRIPTGGLIIREDQIDYFKQFGNGFESLKFVGCMLDEE